MTNVWDLCGWLCIYNSGYLSVRTCMEEPIFIMKIRYYIILLVVNTWKFYEHKLKFSCIWLQCLSVVPLEIFRWVIAGVAGFMSATFVALNLRAHIKSAGERWFLIVAGIFLLQLALSVVLKLYLFTVTV